MNIIVYIQAVIIAYIGCTAVACFVSKNSEQELKYITIVNVVFILLVVFMYFVTTRLSPEFLLKLITV